MTSKKDYQKIKAGWVYLAEIRDESSSKTGWMKFGVSRRCPFKRVRSLRPSMGESAWLKAFFKSQSPFKLESVISSWVDQLGWEREGEYFKVSDQGALIEDVFDLMREAEIRIFRASYRALR
jgi:hypothetical protein